MKGTIMKFRRKNVSVAQRASEFFARRKRIRIAVVGAQNAGKTIFILSIVNHLLDKDLTLTGPGEVSWKVTSAKLLNDIRLPKNVNAFDMKMYSELFDKMRVVDSGEPPPSTNDNYLLQIEVDIGKCVEKGKESRRLLLEIMDVPGERITDLSMYGLSFMQWSVKMRGDCQNVFGGGRAFSDYLGKIEKISGADGVNEVKKAYAEYVMNQAENKETCIFPAELVVRNKGKDKSAYGQDAFFLGDDFFAPLPSSFFEDKEKKEMVRSFSRAYERYVRENGIPEIARWMESANQAYYLVDVFRPLMIGCKKDTVRHAQEALRVFEDRDCNIIKRFGRKVWNSLLHSRAESVTIVATQMDRAVESQRDNAIALANDIFATVLLSDGLKKKKTLVTHCAAIRFGRDGTNDQGRPRIAACYSHDPHSADIHDWGWVENEVPKSWEEFMKADEERRKKFAYPYLLPRIAEEKELLYHLHMERILSQMLLNHSDNLGQGSSVK